MFQSYLIRAIGIHRGAPRLYLDGAFLASTAFQPGAAYSVRADENGERLVLQVDPLGRRTVSSKIKGGQHRAVIDINSRSDLEAFAGVAAARIVVTRHQVYILIPASERNRRERLRRLIDLVQTSKPLRTASLAHGVGVMSHACHQGLSQAGVEATLEVVNEIDTQFVAQAKDFNDSWGTQTRAIASPLQEMVQDRWLLGRLGPVEIVEAGIPCSGASKAGKSKRGLVRMEGHPEVGHLVAPTIMAIAHLQPVCFVLENVPDYATSASADILRNMLRDMGYSVHETVLDGRNFGSNEGRVRWFAVAMTNGIDLDLQQVQSTALVSQSIASSLDAVPLDDPRWRSFEHLRDKESRDAAKGDSFAMQIVSQDDLHVPTLRKGYQKGGSTDPLLRHPVDPKLLRLFTPAEHARFKGVPSHLVEGLADTRAHQGLGQSVTYKAVVALFEVIGNALVKFVERAHHEPVNGASRPQYQLAQATG
jgi:DNA (cytosine-5)-methyltransferase 1